MANETPFVLLKWLVRAGGNYAGLDPFTTEGAADFVQSLAKDLWEGFFSKRAAAERAEALEQIAQSSPGRVIDVVAEELNAIPDAERREMVRGYVAALPGTIRASLRRKDDPTGRSVPPALVPHSAEAVARFLPARVPRFKEGDQPPGIGDWQLVELLGTGGFGEVWRARNPHLPSEVAALKFCLDPKAAVTLRREAALLARVRQAARQHPGIVPLRHTYLGADPPCLEYEFVEGGTFTGYIQELHHGGRPPGAQEAADLIAQLAEVMALCHSLPEPIVHRDLKPANILVQRAAGPNGGIRLRITDFGLGGIAMERAREAARAGVSVARHSLASVHGSHTPLYASPEQVRGEPTDPRDDVYALGVIWWQILCGDLGAGAPTGRWMRQLESNGQPKALVELLADCLEPRSARLGSAEVLKAKLMSLEVIAVHPPPATHAISKPEANPARHALDTGAVGKVFKATLPGRVELKLCYCPAGSFTMGSPADEEGRRDNEQQVQVTLSRAFWTGQTEVTQGQWAALMGTTPAQQKAKGKCDGDVTGVGADHPMYFVSAEEADAYVAVLNGKAPLAEGWKWALLTEAQWEYACRAPSSADGPYPPFSFGHKLNGIEANCDGNHPYGTTSKGPYLEGTSKVGSYAPNAWGLYDMHGNVWEWCADRWDGSSKLPGGTDPVGKSGSLRVVRGGSWINGALFCRAADRKGNVPGLRDSLVGFRVAAVPAGRQPQ